MTECRRGRRKVLSWSVGPVFWPCNDSRAPQLKTTQIFHEELGLRRQPGTVELEILISINLTFTIKRLITGAL